LKARQYDLVIPLMKKRNWNVNNQNVEGNTFGHILAHDNSISAVRIFEQLTKKKNYLPNIKNNKGETALDRALDNNYLCTAFKILEDKRFNDIDVFSFKNLFNVCIKNTYYGKYSKLNNLEIIVENLEKKELNPGMKNLVENISNNMEAIKEDIMNNKSNILESIINSHLVTE
jgi:ankyrin repeat protein